MTMWKTITFQEFQAAFCRFSLAPKVEFNFHPGNEHFELIEKD